MVFQLFISLDVYGIGWLIKWEPGKPLLPKQLNLELSMVPRLLGSLLANCL